MTATVTLATTTLSKPCNPRETIIYVASSSGILPGLDLFIGRELMRVRSIDPSTGGIKVMRGVDSTAAVDHSSSEVVTIGRPDQFYQSDPVGRPSETTQVAPWINAKNGKVWYAQGDAQPTGVTFRWWQDVTTTYSIGALGIRTTDAAPTSST